MASTERIKIKAGVMPSMSYCQVQNDIDFCATVGPNTRTTSGLIQSDESHYICSS